jgi:hypothetical protein
MPRSSESVAALAAALAKAQAELANPEKSRTATIRTGRPGDDKRSFRYAPLSSGLDIVRKTLGQHEIATLQTTAIDQAAGMVHLTTMLAHASGEWIASDWPVCPTAETANPQRMGAALTYARRYALFTLVGIAGEDDLDAPDLCHGPLSASASALGASVRQTNDQPGGSPRTPGNGHARSHLNRERPGLLDADQSSALRKRLVLEIEGIPSPDLAAAWARGALAMPSSWKKPLNAGSRSFPRRQALRMTVPPKFKMLRLRPSQPKSRTTGKQWASIRASSPFPRRGVIATASILAPSPSSHV